MSADFTNVWDRILCELIDGNGAIELAALVDRAPGQPQEPGGGLRHKARPLAYDAEHRVLTTERVRPRQGEPHSIHTHQRVEVYLINDTTRLVATHEVREIAPYQLNERQRITALTLARVGAVMSAQRRSYFRVDTAAAEFSQITLNRRGKDGRELRPVRGRLVNLSAGGVGVQVPMQDFTDDPEPRGRRYDFLLRLPGTKDPVAVPVSIRRACPVKQGDLYLGMAFEFDPAQPEHQRTQAALLRLTTDLQREQLRRRRSA